LSDDLGDPAIRDRHCVPNLAAPLISGWSLNTRGTLHGHVDDAGKGVIWTTAFAEVEMCERLLLNLEREQLPLTSLYSQFDGLISQNRG
jgi:hypothetical protein